MQSFTRRHPLLSFYLLAYAFTWAVAAPLLAARRGLIAAHPPEWLEPVAAFGPFIAAMLVARAVEGRAGTVRILRSLGHWRVGVGPLTLAVMSPVVLLGLAYFVVSLLGTPIDADGNRLAELATAAGLVDLVLISAVIQSWGEEPGWRGFALPRLRERFGPLGASVVLWPVWLCWHLPFFLSRPEFGLMQWIAFSVGILSAAIWLTLVWEATGSVLMALAWHAMVNICRGLALAMSTAMFLAVSNAVLIGAVVIAIYWLIRGRRDPEPLGLRR
jgi:membrane protease YdiL (CAAX protease family)